MQCRYLDGFTAGGPGMVFNRLSPREERVGS